MDIKIHGLTRPIVEEAIRKNKRSKRVHPRQRLWKHASQSLERSCKQICTEDHSDPRSILQKIGDVVGQRGKTINAIIERTGVQIDITDEGAVSICGVDQARHG